MANNIQIGIDPRTLKHLSDQMDLVKKGAGKSMYRALIKVAFRIKSDAQLRLTGRGHIITSRLKNSIFVKSQKMSDVLTSKNGLTYTDNDKKSYQADLTTVKLGDNELAIGTNVEYAPFIEFGTTKFSGDSYLYWAMKNINIQDTVGQNMANDLKYGKFLKSGVTK